MDCTFPWRNKQTERYSELCKLIERKPGKVNEIPLKVNETPGSRGRKKTQENEKMAAGKTVRPRCNLNFKAKNARKKQDFCKFLAFLHKKFRTAILSKLPSYMAKGMYFDTMNHFLFQCFTYWMYTMAVLRNAVAIRISAE